MKYSELEKKVEEIKKLKSIVKTENFLLRIFRKSAKTLGFRKGLGFFEDEVVVSKRLFNKISKVINKEIELLEKEIVNIKKLKIDE